MKRTLLFILISIPLISAAQLDEDYEYTKEFIWGPQKNSNGGTIGSVIFRWSRGLGNDTFRSFGFELSNVHPQKEAKVQTANGSFLYGRTNYLYVIRLQYGRKKIFFRKDTQQGVQINAGFSGGPSFGFHSPYYVLTSDGQYEKFDPNGSQTVTGSGRLFQGLAQSNNLLGVNLRGGISFEFGTYKNNVAGLEIGAMLEAYGKEVVLNSGSDHDSIFTSAYVTLFWGKRK